MLGPVSADGLMRADIRNRMAMGCVILIGSFRDASDTLSPCMDPLKLGSHSIQTCSRAAHWQNVRSACRGRGQPEIAGAGAAAFLDDTTDEAFGFASSSRMRGRTADSMQASSTSSGETASGDKGVPVRTGRKS